MRLPSHSPRLDPPHLRADWPLPFAVFSALLLLYGWTAPPSVVFEDDGGFIMAAHFLGIPHPPGYPLYVLLAKLVTLVPLGSIAWRVHLFSGLMGAATSMVLWWILRTLSADRWLALVIALAFGVSPVMWSQAIIAEVYTLNTFLYFSLFAMCLCVLHSGRATLVPAMGLLCGLALCNHMPLFLLASPCFVGILWPVRYAVLRRFPMALLGLLLGLLPYLWMFLRSHAEPEISFYGPIRDLREFIYYVSREGYVQVENRATAGISDKINFAIFLVHETARQFTIAGTLVGLIGFGRSLLVFRPSWNLGLIWGFLSGSFLLVALIDMDFQRIQQMIFRVYPLIAYGILAIWIATGLSWLREVLTGRMSALARPLGMTFGALLAGYGLYANLSTNDRHRDTFAHDYAMAVLTNLSPNAALFAATDANAFPIGYLNLVEGVRPDVDLFHPEGLVFSTRLLHARDGTPRSRYKATHEFIRNSRRPVFFMLRSDFGYGYDDLGFYARIDRTSPAGAVRYRLQSRLLEDLRAIEAAKGLVDPWSDEQRKAVLANFAPVLVHALHRFPDDPRAEQYRADLDRASRPFVGALWRLRAEIEIGEKDPVEFLADANRIGHAIDWTVSKGNRARFFILRGRLHAQLEDGLAEKDFRLALQIFPDPRNEAIRELLRRYAARGETEKYRRLRSRIYRTKADAELMKLDRQVAQ